MQKNINFSLANHESLGKAMKGLDPNVDEEIPIKRWMKAHPEKRILSEEEKQIRRERMQNARVSSTGW